jgi:alkylresorcinol/alkylpyrone synthase
VSPLAYIQSIVCQQARHQVTQSEVERVVNELFEPLVETRVLQRLLGVFHHNHIHTRQFVQPLSWYRDHHSVSTIQDTFIQEATDLAVAAGSQALIEAATDSHSIAAIVVATTTGFATPSIDAYVAQRLGLAPWVFRVPLVGLGCAAGVSGLHRAALLCHAMKKPVLFVTSEVCSITFQRNDGKKSNIVGSSLFGDGAAAVVLHPTTGSIEVLDGYSHLYADTYDVMGWDVQETGLHVQFSQDIPSMIENTFAEVVGMACATTKINRDDLQQLVVHPGGAKVLQAYQHALGVDPQALQPAYDVLQRHGNMSSPTVLFVLKSMLQLVQQSAGPSLMAALGPGFSAEFLFIKGRQ